jgi:hypothetical protein
MRVLRLGDGKEDTLMSQRAVCSEPEELMGDEGSLRMMETGLRMAGFGKAWTRSQISFATCFYE